MPAAGHLDVFCDRRAKELLITRNGVRIVWLLAEADRARYESILNQSSVNLTDRRAAWQKSGWNSYDPSSKPYGADEVRKERQLYGSRV